MQTELEHILISTYKDGMISYMDSHPEVFEEAVELALADKQPYSWRVAWLVGNCIKENDPRIQKYIKKIIDSLANKSDGHQRELIKILLQMELKKKYEGVLFNICMNIWEQIDKSPSVRITAFKFILKIMKKHHELSHEVAFLTQDHYLDTLSPGVRNSISKMLNGVSPDVTVVSS